MLFHLRMHDHKLINCVSNTLKFSAYVCPWKMNALLKDFLTQKVAL